ncbi:MAG: ribosome recycling factor [Erysipelotrichaceae bacterium]|nr:ribosome recycling factor [Erysipelotrichaceae bacterium]
MENLAKEMREAMLKSIENLKSQFNTLRTGRASASVLDRIEVDYYGAPTPIHHIATISTPEPQQLLIKPYDRGDVKSIVAAIGASDLGINPVNEGNQIRLTFPTPTEERRRELVKVAKRYTEEAKVAIRNIRRDYMDIVKSEEGVSEDYQKRIEAELQKVTDELISMSDDVCKKKESEIMTI